MVDGCHRLTRNLKTASGPNLREAIVFELGTHPARATTIVRGTPGELRAGNAPHDRMHVFSRANSEDNHHMHVSSSGVKSALMLSTWW
jgi:hypothetical protein